MASSFKDLLRPKTSKQFISAAEIEENRQRQIELYQRLGQEPPSDPNPTDTRSLAERLADAQLAKQEQDELERNSLRNYVSILDEDDVEYLNDVAHAQKVSELERIKMDNNELNQFRQLQESTSSVLLGPGDIVDETSTFLIPKRKSKPSALIALPLVLPVSEHNSKKRKLPESLTEAPPSPNPDQPQVNKVPKLVEYSSDDD